MLVLWYYFVSIFWLWDIIFVSRCWLCGIVLLVDVVIWYDFVRRYRLCNISFVSNSLWFFDIFLLGVWCDEVVLYVIGGGYDFGFIKVLGLEGTNKI